MKFNFKDFFTYNKRERNGIFILLSIIAILLIYLSISDDFILSKKINFSDFDNEITAFEKAQNKNSDSTKTKLLFAKKKHKDEETLPEKLFLFDPNTATKNDWLELGVSEKEIKIIENYVSKGGHFYKKEDLKKIYGFSEKQYLALIDYIQIAVPKKKIGNKIQIVSRKNSFNPSNWLLLN